MKIYLQYMTKTLIFVSRRIYRVLSKEYKWTWDMKNLVLFIRGLSLTFGFI